MTTQGKAEEIRAWLTAQIATLLNVSEDEIGPDETFDSFGLASRDAVSLSGDLEDYLGRRLSPTLLYQHPTIRQLADHLAGTEPQAHRAEEGDLKKKTGALMTGALTTGALTTGALTTGALTEAAVAEMSDEEAEAALLRKLQELDE